MSTQSKPAPALAYILQEEGSRDISSSSQLPISPPTILISTDSRVEISQKKAQTCIPERSIHGHEIAKLLLLQSLHELRPRHAVTPRDVELGGKLFVKVMIPLDVVSEMKNNWLAHGEQNLRREEEKIAGK